MNPFKLKGVWLKGNLHTHSTNSDGVLTPEQVADFYASNGYGFLSITDHEKLTKICHEKLVLIPGLETSVGETRLGYSYHLVVLGVEDEETIQRLRRSIEELIDFVDENDGLVFVAHPYWSGLTIEDLIKLEKYIGIEVYNTGCDVECAKGFSMVHWDGVLAHNRLVYGLAVDDAHRYVSPPVDALGGWVWVKTETPSAEAILDSLKRGLFYASMGPIVDDFSHGDGFVEASFTPVDRVDLVSDNGWGLSISSEVYEKLREMLEAKELKGVSEVELNVEDEVEELYIRMGDLKALVRKTMDGFTYFSVKNYGFKKYFRVELTDGKGRKAWINPVFL